MAIGHTKTEKGLGQRLISGLAEGAAHSLGSQAVNAAGALIGKGAEKLGITGPSKAEIDLIIEKGLAKDKPSAIAWLKQNPRFQAADLARTAQEEKEAAEKSKWEQLNNKPQEMPENIDPAIAELAADPNMTPEQLAEAIRMQQSMPEENPEKYLGKPEFYENPKDLYRRKRAEGLSDAEAKTEAKFESEYNKPRYEKALGAFDKARTDLETVDSEKARYRRLYKLESKGELPSSQVAGLTRYIEQIFRMHPGELNYLLGASSEEAEKLLADTLKDAKQYFGARMTDADLTAWFKRLPSLMQSSEGRLRALADLYTFSELKELHAKAAQDIVKQNNGKIPLELEQRVDARISKKRNKLLDMFENGESNLPNYQKNLKKATKRSARERKGGLAGGVLGAGLGGLGAGYLSALAAPALGAAGSALGGSILGSAAGPIGAVLGGLGGAYTGFKAGSAAGAAGANKLHELEKGYKTFEKQYPLAANRLRAR